jgi:transcriptional antiterminator RfaH
MRNERIGLTKRGNPKAYLSQLSLFLMIRAKYTNERRVQEVAAARRIRSVEPVLSSGRIHAILKNVIQGMKNALCCEEKIDAYRKIPGAGFRSVWHCGNECCVYTVENLMEHRIAEISDSGDAWYCARTQPKHEHLVAGNLAKRLGLGVFHPRLRMERATRRGMVRVIEPLFPCYVFIRCNLAQYADDIRYLDGISSLVHFGSQIPNIPDEVIEELRACFEANEPMSVENRLRPGSEVTIAEGAFLGSRGVVVRLLPAKQRVQVLLEFLGRSALTEVDRKSLTINYMLMPDLMPALAVKPGLNATVAA